MKRGWFVLGLVTMFLVAVAGLALAFGTPQAPPTPASVSPPSPAVAGGGVASPSDSGASGGQGSPFGGEVVEGEIPAPDPESPFAFQIPGCRCHSDDPVVVEEHASYRLNQCRGCHAGSPR